MYRWDYAKEEELEEQIDDVSDHGYEEQGDKGGADSWSYKLDGGSLD